MKISLDGKTEKTIHQKALNVQFTRQTIVVTALTGAAAITVNGQTIARACKLNNKNIKLCHKWKHETCLVIVDEISFCNQDQLTTLNKKLNLL